MGTKTEGLRGSEVQAQTRLLLALWDLGGVKEEVKKSDLTKRVQRTNEKAADYQGIFQQLEKSEAITISKNKVSLSNSKGLEMLSAGLKNADFEFDSQIGAKTANALVKWIREMGTLNGAAIAPAVSAEVKGATITSYDKFKQIALDVYDQLNQDYNLDDLVPIYRIRREIGDRVSRSHFNEWLLEMQANDVLQLQGGSLPDSDPAKIEDSITTELSGLRCYAKRLTP